MSPKSSAVAIVYADASDTGFGDYSVQCGVDLVVGNWSKQHLGLSSTSKKKIFGGKICRSFYAKSIVGVNG